MVKNIGLTSQMIDLREEMQFYRRRKNMEIRKERRKRIIVLKFSYLLILLVMAGGFFYLIRSGYLFLISWEKLNVKEIEVVSQKKELKREIEDKLKTIKLGNILLVNIEILKQELMVNKWVKEIYVKKILPSTLRIKILERIPIAILEKDGFYLLGDKGVKLEKIDKITSFNLPVITLEREVKKGELEKIKLALTCLNGIDVLPLLKDKVVRLDISDYKNVSIWLKNNPTKVLLGNNNFSSKLKFYLKIYPKLKALFKQLDYVDLRFEGRIYVKPLREEL
ncbi:MAG: cell division protein FtsQ/DivIB [Candidatus Aminicenantia bacterium]